MNKDIENALHKMISQDPTNVSLQNTLITQKLMEIVYGNNDKDKNRQETNGLGDGEDTKTSKE